MSDNTKAVVSFTFDDITKDINYDRIFLFILSYEFNLNFNQIMTLFNFSSDIFWTYINTFRPMLKLGDRKAAMLKHSARKIYFKYLGSKIDLNEKEMEYYNYLTIFLNDSFTNGEQCLHSSSIDMFPMEAKGNFIEYRTGKRLDKVNLVNQEDLYRYIDSIETITINGELFHKTSRVEFLLEKYYGDLNHREIRRKSVKELRNMMSKESIDLYNQEILNKSITLLQHRMELVYRNG